MHLVIKVAAALTISLIVCSCSSLKFPGVYRVVVQQGNFIEEEMVEQLEKGMSREQVRYIMGTPMIADTFNNDRWDYYFNVKRGDKVLKEYQFRVLFENDQLAHWEGDYRKKNQQMDSTTGKSDPKILKPAPDEKGKPTPLDKSTDSEES